MKENIKNLFSLSAREEEYTMQEKFELVSCPNTEEFCKELRPAINKDYLIAQQFHFNKDYQKSIESLNNAYNKTLLLTKPACTGCAEFFRKTILEYMTDIQNEQKKPVGLIRFIKSKLIPLSFKIDLREVKIH